MFIPLFRRYFFNLSIVIAPEWNIDAANAPSTLASLNTLTK